MGVSIFKLLGALGVFLYGMRVMSDGIQKVAGDRMQAIMNYMTRNRIKAVLTGLIITGIIQSSSATTVMVVSFVNASLLTLTQAIGVIMGANIGTTVTTWIVSIFGFKFKITAMALPVVGFGLPFIFSKIKRRRDFGEILIGFGLLFLGLMFLKESVPDIKSNPEVLSFLQDFTGLGFLSFVIFVAAGALLTVVVQSSSAVLAITVTMAFMGWIDFPTGAAIVLGGNIGTTITVYLASIGTNVNARRAARAHFLFNVIGVLLIAFVFTFFIDLVYQIAPWDATVKENFPLNLSLFHTIFNVINTIIFLPFIKQFAALVQKMVKQKKGEISTEYSLKSISTGIQSTAQMRIVEAEREIEKMAEITRDMFEEFLEVFKNPDKKMGDKVEKVRQQECLTDQMQEEITRFLMECSKESLSEASVNNVRTMMRVINELENIGDSCFKLLILTQRKYDKKITLHTKAYEEFDKFANLIHEFMNLYTLNINRHIDDRSLEKAFKLENEINHLRDKFKKASRLRLKGESDVKAELLYLDFIRHFEHIGDNSLNIAQALRSMK